MAKKECRKLELLAISAAVTCLGTACFFSPAEAADPDISIGLGVAAVPDYEGSDDYEAWPVPFASAEWQSGRYAKLMGNSLRVNLLADKNLHLGPVLQYRRERDDDVDSDAVGRMRKIDSAVEAGLFLGYKANDWDASVQIVHDISDEHDGLLVKGMVGYTLKAANGLTTRVGVFTTYADDDYMDTYFSVDADNAARSGLPVYTADEDFKDVGVDLTMRYSFTAEWDVMGIAEYKALLNDAEDSPVVDREGDASQFMGGVVFIYNF